MMMMMDAEKTLPVIYKHHHILTYTFSLISLRRWYCKQLIELLPSHIILRNTAIYSSVCASFLTVVRVCRCTIKTFAFSSTFFLFWGFNFSNSSRVIHFHFKNICLYQQENKNQFILANRSLKVKSCGVFSRVNRN